MIARLRERFFFVGKTNQHELAAGGTNLVSACGRTGNPWDPARMTGGSSGGSGAAVAAGIVPFALGSDTGGSIRIPASMCGTFGLKPTTGRLPIDGMMPLAPSMDCPGPMAATAEDLERLFQAMAGPAAGSTHQGSSPRRIALLEGFFSEVVHHEIQSLVLATAATFEAAGVKVESIDGRGIGDARATWMDVCCPEFAEAHPLLKDPDRRRLVGAQPREWLQRGERTTAEQTKVARRRREEIGRWYRSRLSGVDALLVPTTPYPAPRADQETVDLGGGRTIEIDRVGPGFITSSVNLAGLPALNLPAGRSSDGVPIGVSLVGRDGGDETLLLLARLWEVASGYRPARPTASLR
jgi:aspartyl-tRNA(Asn)/glutamyl-tRNA(Gln) amidotransferase subunit A